MKKKDEIQCIIVFRDEAGLGHIPFISYLSECLPSNYTLHILLGPTIEAALFPFAQVHQIPESIDFSSENSSRSAFISKILKEIDPDILFVDYFPFGRFSSFPDFLHIEDFVHNKGGKVISVMRDLYLGTKLLDSHNYAQFVSKIQGSNTMKLSDFIKKEFYYILGVRHYSQINDVFFVQLFLEYFLAEKMIDAILVFGDKDVFDLRDEFELTEELSGKFYHLGYIPKDQEITHVKDQKTGGKKVLISSGGNISAEENFLSLVNFFSRQDDYEVRILLGPYVEEKLRDMIFEMLADIGHIEVSGFISDFDALLEGADYFFGYGGYGTFQHLFHYQGSAFIMSNYNSTSFRTRFYEQKYRTLLFEKKLNIQYLDVFTPEYLQTCMNNKNVKSDSLDTVKFCKKGDFQKTIEEIFQD